MTHDRANRVLAAVASVASLVAGVVAVATQPAAAATSAATLAAPGSGGAQQVAIVALAGDHAVSVPGVRVVSVLRGVHSEVVDATSAALAALATQPGVLGVSPNATAHLDSASFGQASVLTSADRDAVSQKSTPANNSGSWPCSTPTPSPSAGRPTRSPTAPVGTPTSKPTTVPTASPSPTDSGVLAPASVGGAAGTAGAGSGVTVALIDTGVSDTAALNRASGRLVDAVDTSGLNGGNSIREHGTFTDGFGHGTFMASLIAGGPVSGSGVAGVGVAPGATVDVVKVADDQGNTSLAAVLAGLNWVATHSDSVDVANLSLSVDPPNGGYGLDPLTYAVELTRDAGVTVVVAAGNTPGKVGDPGFTPAALTVGAADTTAAKPVVAPFSGSGNVDGVAKPDVVAAGVNLLGVMPANTVIAREYPAARQPSGLFRGSGTSQSTAIVSGLAALYLQAHPSASPQAVKSAIRGAAKPIAAGPADGQGLVSIPTGTYGSNNTGESSLNIFAWNLGGLAWPGLFGVNNGSFDARRWAARRWAADGWDARRWADVTFDARRWAARRWATTSWDARRWAVASWGDDE